jgi:RimJ/RimL family protein N-acetyltransferase
MKTIQGKNINLRLAEVKDAEFILKLRMQTHKTQFLNQVENNLEKQQDWLKSYKQKERAGLEYYFIIESKHAEQLGLVRVYDLLSDSYCWGSWLIKDDAPITTAIESALLVYEFGFGELSYKKSHFDVRKGNERVIAFHKRLGATAIGEDELNLYFNYSLKNYLKIKQKYRRYLN